MSALRGFASESRGALFNPETSMLVQKRHPYTGNLKSETPGHRKSAFLHWGDVAIPLGSGLMSSLHLCFQARMSDESQLAPHPRL